MYSSQFILNSVLTSVSDNRPRYIEKFDIEKNFLIAMSYQMVKKKKITSFFSNKVLQVQITFFSKLSNESLVYSTVNNFAMLMCYILSSL